MNLRHARAKLLETAIVVAIMCLVVAITVRRVDDVRERAYAVDCDVYRDLVEEGEVAFVVRRERSTTDPRELVDEGILQAIHVCRSGGHHDWIPFPPQDRRFHRFYGCSIHWWPDDWGPEDTSRAAPGDLARDEPHGSNREERSRPAPPPRPPRPERPKRPT